jgi:hypothetical protein
MQVLLMIVQLCVSGAAAALNGLFFGAGFAVAACLVERRMNKK